MKKIIFIFLTSLLMLLSPLNIFAETFSFDDVYMNLDIDTSKYDIVLDAKNPLDGETLSAIGFTQEELDNYFNEQGIVFDASKFSPYFEFSVVVREDDTSKSFFNLNEFSEDEIKNSLLDEFELNSDATVYSTKFEVHNNINMIVIELSNNTTDSTIYTRSYATIYNGKYINLNFHAYDENDFNTFNDEITNIVDSINFTKTLENTNKTTTAFSEGLTNSISYGAISGIVSAAFILLIILLKKKQH